MIFFLYQCVLCSEDVRRALQPHIHSLSPRNIHMTVHKIDTCIQNINAHTYCNCDPQPRPSSPPYLYFIFNIYLYLHSSSSATSSSIHGLQIDTCLHLHTPPLSHIHPHNHNADMMKIFLNYKLKSVAHMPWRVMAYKVCLVVIG